MDDEPHDENVYPTQAEWVAHLIFCDPCFDRVWGMTDAD